MEYWNYTQYCITKDVNKNVGKIYGEERRKQNLDVILKPIVSVITFNINELNALILRQKFSDWITKPNPTIGYL